MSTTTDSSTRIPAYDGDPEKWANAMHDAGLAYHIDDDPETIIECGTGKRTFTDAECVKLRAILTEVAKEDDGYERVFKTFIDRHNAD